jgi:putative phosphoesterase
MKIFVISDLHGSAQAFTGAMRAFELEGADLIVIAGDYLNHGPRNPLPQGYDPQALALLLNERRERIVAVRGNCDSEVDQMLLAFPCLAEYSTVFADGRRIFVTHGHRYADDALPPLSAGDIYLCGHTHVPRIEERAGIILINPGSISLPKGGFPASYALIEPTSLSIMSLAGELLFSRTLI